MFTSLQIGARLRRVRTLADYSQRDLATKVGMTNSAISAIEQGRRVLKFQEAIAIAEQLDLSLDDLIPVDDRRPRTPHSEPHIWGSGT